MAERVAVMNEGRIEQLGTPEEIYKRPVSRFVADFIGDSNFFDVTIDGDSATLADGTRVACVRGARPNGPATLMVRPEAIDLGERANAPPGAVAGTAVQASFLGSYLRVAVECPVARGPVMVAVHGRKASFVPEPDTEVAIWWAVDEAVALEPRRGEGAT